MTSPPTLFSPCVSTAHIYEKLAIKGVLPPPNATKRLSCAFRAHLFDGVCVPKELPQTLHRPEQMLGKKLSLSAAPSFRNCQQGGNRKPRGRRAEASISTIMRKAARTKTRASWSRKFVVFRRVRSASKCAEIGYYEGTYSPEPKW